MPAKTPTTFTEETIGQYADRYPQTMTAVVVTLRNYMENIPKSGAGREAAQRYIKGATEIFDRLKPGWLAAAYPALTSATVEEKLNDNMARVFHRIYLLHIQSHNFEAQTSARRTPRPAVLKVDRELAVFAYLLHRAYSTTPQPPEIAGVPAYRRGQVVMTPRLGPSSVTLPDGCDTDIPDACLLKENCLGVLPLLLTGPESKTTMFEPRSKCFLLP